MPELCAGLIAVKLAERDLLGAPVSWWNIFALPFFVQAAAYAWGWAPVWSDPLKDIKVHMTHHCIIDDHDHLS